MKYDMLRLLCIVERAVRTRSLLVLVWQVCLVEPLTSEREVIITTKEHGLAAPSYMLIALEYLGLNIRMNLD